MSTLDRYASFPFLVLPYQGFSGDLVAAHEEASHLASEAISNIRTVAALSLDSRLMQLFKQRLAALIRRAALRGQIAGFGFGFTSFLLYACFAFSFWFQVGALQVERKSVESCVQIKCYHLCFSLCCHCLLQPSNRSSS